MKLLVLVLLNWLWNKENIGISKPLSSTFSLKRLNVGSDIINAQALQETYPHLAVIDPLT